MHYIKCGANSSLHNAGCCIRSVAPWIAVLSQHTVFTKRVIYYKFTFVRYSAKQAPRTGLRHIWRTVCPLFGHEKNTDGRADGMVISLASVCCGRLLLRPAVRHQAQAYVTSGALCAHCLAMRRTQTAEQMGR